MRAVDIRVLLGVAATASLLAIPAATAQAGTEIGQTGLTLAGCPSPATIFQQTVGGPPTYTTPPGGGVITSWSTLVAGTSGAPQVKLAILHPTGAPNQYTTVAASEAQTLTPNQLNTFGAATAVQGGDQLGLLLISGAYDCFRTGAEPGATMNIDPAINDVGTTDTYTNPSPAGYRLNASAIVEPDCDGDGLGDETQDQDLARCPPAPGTTITAGPKDKVKTKKKRAKVTFSFSANEQGATFNCMLDGKQEFRTCTSPLTISVKKGEHTFSVQATDPGGNQGAAATDTFKVKRKRKRGK